MLIDFHTHAFPDKIAPDAVQKLAHAAGGLTPHTDGTVTALKREMQQDGVDLSVVQNIATNPAKQSKVNDFAISLNEDPVLIAFGSVHPDAPDTLEELERLHDAGIKGIKFQPEYQRFYADEARMKPIYKKISQLGFVTLFHAGNDYGFPPPYHCMPQHLLGALKWFDSPVVAAHWGGLGCAPEVMEKLVGTDLYFDTSFGYGTMAAPLAQQIIDRHGPDKLLFGSDMPWHRPAWELKMLNALDISPADREKILCGNAKKLLGLA